TESLGDIAALDLLDVRFEVEAGGGQRVERRGTTDGPGGFAAYARRQAVRQDGRCRLDRHGPLDGIFQLADVARPVVVREQLHGIVRNGRDVLVHLLGVLDEKVLGQQRNV